MATFTNQATLTYNGVSTTSNVVSGEITETLAVTKTAVDNTYNANGEVTYVVNIVNSGTTDYTNLTVTDNLGAYTSGTLNLVPLTYSTGSIIYLVNGAKQTAPAVTAGPPLTVTGINVPAGGNATLIYAAKVNEFAPLTEASAIQNTATVTGGGLVNALSAAANVTLSNEPILNITKAVNPTTVNENGTLTYTFTIENRGNAPADAADGVVLTDNFDPILDITGVTFNGAVWSAPTNYTYDAATGAFATVEGQIVVPAATYTQNAATGAWTVEPGVSTLTVTGTI